MNQLLKLLVLFCHPLCPIIAVQYSATRLYNAHVLQPPASRPASAAAASSTSSAHDAVLRQKIDELEKLGVGPDEVLRYVRRRIKENGGGGGGADRATTTSGCRQDGSASRSDPVRVAPDDVVPAEIDIVDRRLMVKYLIRNRTATCNDGSRAGYYIRKSSTNSKRWIIYLDGGWMCFDEVSCQSRWLNTPHLMSSDLWPSTRQGSGILSSDVKENPFIHNGNMVFVPYCSSDAWSGTYRAKRRGEFSFVGALILDELMTDLIALHGLASATDVYLAGSSAGGTGVLLNLDRIAARVSTVSPSVRMRGIVDSGWFLDNLPYRYQPCTDALLCSPSDSVQRGITLWNGLIPDDCRQRFARSPWMCYFGYRLYSSMRTIVFIVQHLFDEAQIIADNVGPPVYRQQWQYIHRLGLDVRNSLNNVSAVFAPACLSHVLLTRSEWHVMQVNGVTLPDALTCWEKGKHETNGYDVLLRRKHKSIEEDTDWDMMTRTEPNVRGANILADEGFHGSRRLRNNGGQHDDRNPRLNRVRHERHRQRPKRRKSALRNDRSLNDSFQIVNSSRRHQPTPVVRLEHVDGRRRQRQRRGVVFDEHDVHRLRHDVAGCYHRVVDACVWPQCNVACPNVRNPFTGREMDLVDLLRTQIGGTGAVGSTGPSSLPRVAAKGAAELANSRQSSTSGGGRLSDRDRMLRQIMETGR